MFDDPKNIELSKLFGAPFVLNSAYRDKTFRKEAAKKGKQILVYEAGESLRFNKLAISEGINGCLRMLNKLKMLDVDVPEVKAITLNQNKMGTS